MLIQKILPRKCYTSLSQTVHILPPIKKNAHTILPPNTHSVYTTFRQIIEKKMINSFRQLWQHPFAKCLHANHLLSKPNSNAAVAFHHQDEEKRVRDGFLLARRMSGLPQSSPWFGSSLRENVRRRRRTDGVPHWMSNCVRTGRYERMRAI